MISACLRSSHCKQARSQHVRRTVFASCMAVAGALGPSPDALSEEVGGRLMLQGSPTVIHFDPSPEHTKWSWAVGGEYIWPSRWLAGLTYFNNSFNQKSQYIYGGYYWRLTDDAARYWYFKLSGGVILGYKEPYENKIPFNNDGVAPGIVPGLGYQYDRFNVQVNLLGTAGLMITVGYDVLR